MVEKLEALKDKLIKKYKLLNDHRFDKLEKIKISSDEIKERIDDYTSIPDTDPNINVRQNNLRNFINNEVENIKTTIKKWNI